MFRFLCLEINEGELEEIFEELSEAQETIYKCYDRLKMLGVLKMEKKADSGN